MIDTSQTANMHMDDAAPLISDTGVAIATEKLQGRSRRIYAALAVPCSVEHLWRVLTDYDNLASFIPNLTVSRCIGNSPSGTLLEQIGTQCFLNVKFCARVVLNMVEQFPHRLGFTLVEGDFKSFEGAWKLEPIDDKSTNLIYELDVCPPRAVPVLLIERHLCRDLAQNLQAIRQQAVAIAAA